jgi:hypothetical protein
MEVVSFYDVIHHQKQDRFICIPNGAVIKATCSDLLPRNFHVVKATMILLRLTVNLSS